MSRPIIAMDIASARRWINRVLKNVDMDKGQAVTLLSAINTLRSLETKALVPEETADA